MSDMVNEPPHYVEGRRFKVIDVIEDSVKFAPDPIVGGLQWQALKYLHRCWSKDDPKKDLQKAMWYVTRLINKIDYLEEESRIETNNG